MHGTLYAMAPMTILSEISFNFPKELQHRVFKIIHVNPIEALK
jgi:hypothetical protein